MENLNIYRSEQNSVNLTDPPPCCPVACPAPLPPPIFELNSSILFFDLSALWSVWQHHDRTYNTLISLHV